MRRTHSLTLLTLIAVVAAATPAIARPLHWSDDQACATVFVVGVRGSGESRSADDEQRGFGTRAVVVLDALEEQLSLIGVDVGAVSVEYPAIGIGDLARNLLDLDPPGYEQSVDLGVEGLLTTIGLIRSRCPDSLTVIVGYSQGAEVVRRVLADPTLGEGDDIAAAIIIADPQFEQSHSESGMQLRGSFASRRFGIRNSMFTTTPAQWVAPRTFSVCNQSDIVCQFYLQRRLPAGAFNWSDGRAIHEGYDRLQLDPIVLTDVLPLVRERLDPYGWWRFGLLPG